VVHGLFIGTDSGEGWMVAIYIACAVAVGLAVLARIVAVLVRTRRNHRYAQQRGTHRSYGPESGVERAARHAHRTPANSGSRGRS
jgi:hypothetical protein